MTEQFRVTPSLLFLCTIIVLVAKLKAACASNCAACRSSFPDDSFCLACEAGFQTIESGICTQQSMVEHCSIYSQSLSCLKCRPSYQLSYGTCKKMFDGCLIEQDSRCVMCHPGSLLSSSKHPCSIKYLNCLEVDENSQCIACYPSYSLVNGRCMYTNRGCQRIDRDTGLCASCFPGAAELIGYQCVPLSSKNSMENCYLVVEKQGQFSCKMCKEGYAPYKGICLTFTDIIEEEKEWPQRCRDKLYIHKNTAACLQLIFELQNCEMGDFKEGICYACMSNYHLDANGTCLPIRNIFCAQLNGTTCLQCKRNFYLKDGNCYALPPFCSRFTDDCKECIEGFTLKDGYCLDPNCQTLNYVTRQCQMCVVNHRLNSEGVCKFIDPNCAQFNVTVDCVRCRGGYVVKQGLCSYVDKNCQVEDEETGECLECKPFYHYNKQGKLCIPLPDNCLQADISGRCSACVLHYTLLSNYQCVFITAPQHCMMVDQHNNRRCITCREGYFADRQGACQSLPIFCLRYNPDTQRCRECTADGVMDQSGQCVDKNCKIFDQDGSCLACQQSFQFGVFGKCIVQQKDNFCKEYQFGICKSCSQRYYFDFDFKCVPVSAFCKTYDGNSGECMSCYEGYELTDLGECRMNIGKINSLTKRGDVLGEEPCVERDGGGRCLKCKEGYQEVEVELEEGGQKGVNCITIITQTGSQMCRKMDEAGERCVQCVHRMYVGEQGSCLSIDHNCDRYNQTTGECLMCFSGYALSETTGGCEIAKLNDPNCEIVGKEGECSKCYHRFYYSKESLRCLEVDALCATYDLTNGSCLTCYQGYLLRDGLCEQKPTQSVTNQHQTRDDEAGQLAGCLKEQDKKCTVCEWGWVLIQGLCYQRDQNCKTLLTPNSLTCKECYGGYVPFEKDKTKCIQEALLVNHCLKYSSQIECMLCQSGYVLNPSPTGTPPLFTCKIIDPNCDVYSAVLRGCEKCLEGAVIEGRTCVRPVYGLDPECIRYELGLCKACSEGWELQGYLCGQKKPSV